jgi:fatty acid-binding protein DegV
MKIQVITDSTSDLPEGTIRDLGIRVVPIQLPFGEKTYRGRG